MDISRDDLRGCLEKNSVRLISLTPIDVHMNVTKFFPRVILYTFFLFLLIYGGLVFGVLGLGSYIGFLEFGFSVDGVWGL